MMSPAQYLCLAAFLVITIAPAQAAVVFLPLPLRPASIVEVAANCSEIGQQIAASKGGTLVRAAPVQNGQACHIVVVVPAKNGQRARRIETTVPIR